MDLWIIETSTDGRTWSPATDLVLTTDQDALDMRTLVARSNPELYVRVGHYRRYGVSMAVKSRRPDASSSTSTA
jgi:hypothetical protein